MKGPKRPRSVRPRRPGAGLGQIIPSGFSDEEAPTNKRLAVPEEGPTHRLPVVDTVERVKCPKCGGSTLLGIADVDVHEFAVLECDPCDECVDGKVTPEQAAKIRAGLGL